MEKPVYRIIRQGAVKIQQVHVTELAKGVYYLQIDTDEKWPEILEGSYYSPTKGIGLSFDFEKKEEILNETKIEIPWGTDVNRAVWSGRYGWSGFLIEQDLFQDENKERKEAIILELGE